MVLGDEAHGYLASGLAEQAEVTGRKQVWVGGRGTLLGPLPWKSKLCTVTAQTSKPRTAVTRLKHPKNTCSLAICEEPLQPGQPLGSCRTLGPT